MMRCVTARRRRRAIPWRRRLLAPLLVISVGGVKFPATELYAHVLYRIIWRPSGSLNSSEGCSQLGGSEIRIDHPTSVRVRTSP